MTLRTRHDDPVLCQIVWNFHHPFRNAERLAKLSPAILITHSFIFPFIFLLDLRKGSLLSGRETLPQQLLPFLSFGYAFGRILRNKLVSALLRHFQLQFPPFLLQHRKGL